MVSKRIREGAARLCSVMASDVRAYTFHTAANVYESFGIGREAINLKDAAFDYVKRERWGVTFPPTEVAMEFYAEAEALLRTGWTP